MKQGSIADIREYLKEDGSSPFGTWFEDLDAPAAAKITSVVARMEHGNLSHTKPVGKGVYENKIEFGPGYRIYFANDGEKIIILPPWWWDEERTEQRHPARTGILERL